MLFNVGTGPACSSLLNVSADNKFWCAQAKQQMPVLVFTLQDLLALIPPRPTITSLHLKVDAEGADLIVLKGADTAIHRLDTIIIECKAPDGERHHEDECYFDQAEAFLRAQGFNGVGAEAQGGLVNGYFWKTKNSNSHNNQTINNKSSIVPSFLKQGPITHANLYQKMKT